MPDLDSACPKTPITTIFSTKSTMTLRFAKKLPTLGIRYKAIPDLEPTLSKGLLPELPDPTRGIDTSLSLTMPNTWSLSFVVKRRPAFKMVMAQFVTAYGLI